MKIHVGCGPVYLKPSVADDPENGWMNVDLPGERMFLAKDKPDIVAACETSEDDYYGRFKAESVDTLRQGPANRPGACDAHGSFDRLPCGIGESDEILARHVFEHLSLSEARRALDECDRALAPGGLLRIDVPDHDGTVKALVETKDLFYARHLFGSRKDAVGYHVMSYTREGLRRLVEEHGFVFEADEPNVHFYPAFCFKFRKPGIGAVNVDAFVSESGVQPGGKVLDLYGEREPVKRADVALPVDDEKNLAKYADGQFEFALCSGFLESVERPERTAVEISRVAKRGVVVVPHAMREYLFNYEHGSHRWFFLSPKPGEKVLPCFAVDYEFRHRVADSNVSAAMRRVFREGPNEIGHTSRLLRRWYHERQSELSVVLKWEGGFNVKVLA